MKELNVISETSYLSTGNTLQYRRIMRSFFLEYEKMHFQLYKEEVLELLKQYPDYEDYSMDQLKQDLDMLVEWKRLNQNYQDYLREFYSGKAEKILKSVEFILHKDKFISYLREFVQELQVNAAKIEKYFMEISEEQEKVLLEKVIQSELEIPHSLSEIQEPMDEYIRNNVYGKWNALKGWFFATENRPSECEKVLDITDEIIRKIIQNAALIVQLQNWGISRKDDYKKYISMFLDCADVEEAHKLAAHVFGIQHIRHYKVNCERSTDNINSSAYEEEPSEFFLKPRTRAYRPRIDRSGFEIKTWQKLTQRNQYLQQAESYRKMVLQYTRGNCLELSRIEDVLPVIMRETLLRWIALANLTTSKRGRTEYGQEYHLIRTEETCVLKCEDGELVMPAYIFEFAEEENGSS